MKNRYRAALAAAASVMFSLSSLCAMAQDVTLRREYDKVIKSAEVVGSLGTDLFGDQTSFYTGTTEFTATDVSLPGTGLIPVSLSRRYLVEDKRGIYGGAGIGKPVYVFGDWQLDIPHLYGVFPRQGSPYGGWMSSNADYSQRCTVANADVAKPPFANGPQGGTFAPSEYWHGNSLHMPGGGDQEMLVVVPENAQKPADGKTYYWTTAGQWYFSCLPATANGTPGEGFLAIDPNGTRYWFDWVVSWQTQQITKPPFAPAVEPVALHADPLPPDTIEMAPRAYISAFLRRDKVSIYPTKIQDRFGNTVTYTYDAAVKTRLLSIAASDGRTITLGYNGDGRVQSVSDGTRTWQYAYSGGTQLASVTLPDASTWQYNLAALEGLHADDSLIDESSCEGLIMNPTQVAQTGSITHPSGAVGTFTFKPTLHGRSYTNLGCILTPDGQGGAFAFAIHPYQFSSLSLQSKKIQGPGLPASGYAWTYTYGPPNSSKTGCNGCPDTKTVDVQGPNDWARLTFSNRFQQGEGKLVKTETGTGPNAILRTETSSYRVDPAGQTYPARIGETPFTRSDRTSEKHAPLIQRQIVQQGVTFTWQVNQSNGVYSFDAFANPLSVTRSSTLGYSRTDVAAYHHNLAKWVLGQVASSTNSNTGLVESKADYDANALPWRKWAFGKYVVAYTFNADGTVATSRDGNNNVTTFTQWKRGLPGKIAFADGKFKTADIDDLGQIQSVTDENGFITNYDYDTMGRLSLIDYPDGDTVNWGNTTLSFVKSGTAVYGLPAGHWRRTEATGNARKITYYDALWRPVVQETYDSADTGGTLSQTVTRHDADGRVTFASYPQRNLTAAVINTWGNPAVAPNATGTDTAYDALGRVLTIQADSELPGALTTTYEYLSGFQTRITNPRGKATTYRYYAYDQPGTDQLRSVTAPEDALTEFYRDTFGKPLTVLRHNTDSSQSVSRSYTYNASQELCRSIEPETGATDYGYDGAGNLKWSAAGLPTNIGCDAEGDHSAIAPRRVDRTYDARNRPKTLHFPDGLGDQTWAYTPDGLAESIVTDNGGGNVVTNSYTYNRRRLPVGERLQGGGIDWSLAYTYNGNGHVHALSQPNNLYLGYAPNALGQPTQVGSYATGVSYYPNGAVKQFVYGNGLIHTMTQNARGLPENLCDAYGSCHPGAVIYDGYDYDQNGNVAAISDGRTLNRGNRTMTYDGLDRLKTAVSPMFGNASYSYDVLDNLTRTTIGGTAARDHYYCYDAANRLTNVKTGSCAGTSVIGLGYDMQGNLSNKNGATYTFDFGNRLRSASAGNSSYLYDGHGRRVLDAVNGVDKVSFYSQSGQLVFACDYRAGRSSNYISLGNSLVAIADKAHSDGTWTTRYQHTDALGSPVAETDANRVVTQVSEYEPYGGLLNRPLSDGPNYTGHVADAATGLIQMQQRYYDPELAGGRFLSVDPVAVDKVGGNFNRYWYANNNPYKFKDPDGRQSCKSNGNGTMTCDPEIKGMTIATVPMPKGFPNRIDSSQKHAHRYDKLKSAGPGTAGKTQAINREIAKDPTPGKDRPATPNGTLNDATPPGVDGCCKLVSVSSPVMSYSVAGNDGNTMTINVTLPGHPLHPGVVMRGAVSEGGAAVVHNVGIGTGILQSNSKFGDVMFNNVWYNQSQNNIDAAR